MRKTAPHELAVEDRFGTMSRLAASQRGLSLTEILVAVAVISVIAALLAPALSRGRVKAAEIECMQRLRASGQVVMAMIAEKGASWQTFAEGTPEHNQWARRADSLGMIKDRRVTRCPTGATTFNTDHVSWAWQSYGLNTFDLETGKLENVDEKKPREVSYVVYPARIKNASRHVLLADSASNSSGSPLQTFRIYHKVAYRSGIYAWHDGRANVLFFDGHGESVRVADLELKGAPYYDTEGNFRVPTSLIP